VKGSGFSARIRVNVYLVPYTGEVSKPADLRPYTATTTDQRGRYAVSFVMPERWPDGSPIQPGKLQLMVVAQNGDEEAIAVFDYQSAAPAAGGEPDRGPQ
jgi:hypothetical protein